MPEILPRRKCSSLGCSLPPPARPGGSVDPWTGAPGVLLRHCHQADPWPTGGPEAEATGGQDYHRAGALLLHVLAPLWSGHFCGRSAAVGSPAPQLQAGSCFRRVAVGG